MTMAVLTLLIGAAAGAAPLAAQTPAPGATHAPPSSAAASIPLGTRVGDTSVATTGYDESGRRDPFASLIQPKPSAAPRSADVRTRTGLAALSIADVRLSGIVKSGTTAIALIEGPGKQTFNVRVKDRLLDGIVQAIDADGIVLASLGADGRPSGQVRKTMHRSHEDQP